MCKYIYELFGTFIFIFLGLCSILFIVDGTTLILGSSLIFGMSYYIICMVLSEECICSFNPVATLGMFLIGKIDKRSCILYIIFEFLGGLLASIVLLIVAFNINDFNILSFGNVCSGFTYLSPFELSVSSAVIIEIFVSMFFVYVFLRCNNHNSSGNSKVFISLSLIFINLLCINSTLSIGNPVRTFCPALIYSFFNFNGSYLVHALVLLFASFLGCFIALVIYVSTNNLKNNFWYKFLRIFRFNLLNTFSIKQKTSKDEYLSFVIVLIPVFFFYCVFTIDFLLTYSVVSMILSIFTSIICAYFVLSGIIITIRRLKTIKLNILFILFVLIPVVGWILLFILCIKKTNV